jgi:hypothetical protein
MRFPRTLTLAAIAAAIAVLPSAPAKAQYYYPCNAFPLTWPFCIAGAAVGTAAAIATAPFRAPYYYYGSPYYYAPAYYYPRHHYRRHRRYRRY